MRPILHIVLYCMMFTKVKAGNRKSIMHCCLKSCNKAHILNTEGVCTYNMEYFQSHQKYALSFREIGK